MERLTTKFINGYLFNLPPNSDKKAQEEYVDALSTKLGEYEDLEEQGLLLRLPITVNEAVDKLFSHNEIISLWREIKEETSYHELVWNGMAWDIPDELKNCKFVKIFGIIPESIIQADIINIEIALSEEAEVELEKMKGGTE